MTRSSIFATGAVTAYYSMYMTEVGMFKVFCAIAVPQLEGRTSSRVETKIFVFVFSRKVREHLFSLFAKIRKIGFFLLKLESTLTIGL